VCFLPLVVDCLMVSHTVFLSLTFLVLINATSVQISPNVCLLSSMLVISPNCLEIVHRHAKPVRNQYGTGMEPRPLSQQVPAARNHSADHAQPCISWYFYLHVANMAGNLPTSGCLTLGPPRVSRQSNCKFGQMRHSLALTSTRRC
jgi:hypothetical protein